MHIIETSIFYGKIHLITAIKESRTQTKVMNQPELYYKSNSNHDIELL